jgi:hypothetical protein
MANRVSCSSFCHPGVPALHVDLLYSRSVFDEDEDIPRLRLILDDGLVVHWTAYMIAQRFFAVPGSVQPAKLSVSTLRIIESLDAYAPVGTVHWPDKQRLEKHDFWPLPRPASCVKQTHRAAPVEVDDLERAMQQGPRYATNTTH